MNAFNHFNPLHYRYIPRDTELSTKLEEYRDLSILSKTINIVPEIIIPRISSLEAGLLSIASENIAKIVPKRVDGIHDGTVNVGNVFVNYAWRLKSRRRNIELLSLDFNGLEEDSISDRLSDLSYFLVSALAIEANIANDTRHLFRSEIEEYGFLDYGKDRVGSSTMPHKRNPIEFEQVVSFWKTYSPRVLSSIFGQVTEHQGDSTNQQLPYSSFELACAVAYTTKSLENTLKNIRINV